jgi:hypothetical protein
MTGFFDSVILIRTITAYDVYDMSDNREADERLFLQFKCDKCGVRHTPEIEEGSEPEDHWPEDWLLLSTRGIGLPTEDEKVYCSKCKLPILKALGFTSFKAYATHVKALAKEEFGNIRPEEAIAHLMQGTNVPLLMVRCKTIDVDGNDEGEIN